MFYVCTQYAHTFTNCVKPDPWIISGTGVTIILIQQRTNLESTDFNVPWASYKAGFGDPSGNFWLGNDRLHQLTGGGGELQKYRLLVDLQTVGGQSFYATYATFVIDDETNGYQLHVGGYSGTAGDALAYHDGMKFSTPEVGNSPAGSLCARQEGGGFWYNDCCMACLYETSDIWWHLYSCSQVRMSLECA